MDKRLERVIDLKLKELDERNDIPNKENIIKELVMCESFDAYKDIKERYNL